MIEIGNIVTLENNQEFLLIEEIKKETNRYIYAIRVLDDEKLTDEDMIFEALVNADGEFLKVVNDQNLYNQLKEEFKDTLADKILDIDETKLDDEEVA